ncbi:MAG: HDOD domain-containing protein [Deltaproteobacteria bacterium]
MTIDAKLAAEVERLVLARVAAGRIDVPAIGVVAMRCLDVLRAKDFDVRRLVKEIEKEPMIAVMIMRTANAAVYGAHAVTKLEQAAVRLGTARLEVVILEYAARKVFAATGPFAAANRKIWEHSVAVARVSRELASYIGRQDADAYYLAGLLHDIGKPVVAALLLETQRKVAPGVATWLDQATWDRVIANTHHQAARLVGKAWKLPDAIMVGREPSYDIAERRSLANVVRMANAMAKHEGFTTGPVDHAELVVTIASGSTIVGIDPAIVERISVALQEPLE